MPFDPSDIVVTILRNVANLWPARIIEETERGLRFKNGNITAVLLPGEPHFFWPAIGHIEKVDITFQWAAATATADIPAYDNNLAATVRAEGGLLWRIKDPELYWTSLSESGEDELSELASGALKVQMKRNYRSFDKQPKRALNLWKKEVQKDVENFGLQVSAAYLHTYTRRVRNINLMHNND